MRRGSLQLTCNRARGFGGACTPLWCVAIVLVYHQGNGDLELTYSITIDIELI
jgi:hypothetical protein